MLRGFVQSDLGYKTWMAHYELDVPICDSQTEWTPLQREFLIEAFDEYGPDKSNIPNEARKYG